MKNVVHFGAGNIGRGFIGELFFKSFFHVYFADVNNELINKLKQFGTYEVITAEEKPKKTVVKNFSALHVIDDKERLIEKMATAKFITTAVGATILPKIADTIAESLRMRISENISCPQHIIACENQINATEALERTLEKMFSKNMWVNIKKNVIFHNCAVDRIIPNQAAKNLDVVVDPYYEWIVENKTKFQIPSITGMKIVENIDFYIERKLFTVNTGHVATAYIGYLYNKKTIAEVLQTKELYKMVYDTLSETKVYLCKKYNISNEQQEEYIKKILARFSNCYLDDTVIRVGRSPLRKLQKDERLIKVANILCEKEGICQNLVSVIVFALKFDYLEDPEAVSLQNMLKSDGLDRVLTNVCGLTPQSKLFKEIKLKYKK